MPTIKQLERLLIKNQKERNALRDQLDDLQNKQLLPVLKKKFEGKYFKYRNSYSSDNRWYLYSYCKSALSTAEFLCETFECDPYGEWSFHTDKKTGVFLFQEEISQKEYDKAAIDFISAAYEIIQLK